jgi:hypothetical protein
MPKYFFHLRCEESRVSDPTGADLRDPDEAWDAARATAQDLMHTQIEAEVNWLTCRFEVADEAGEVVFELSFAECVESEGKSN